MNALLEATRIGYRQKISVSMTMCVLNCIFRWMDIQSTKSMGLKARRCHWMYMS